LPCSTPRYGGTATAGVTFPQKTGEPKLLSRLLNGLGFLLQVCYITLECFIKGWDGTSEQGEKRTADFFLAVIFASCLL
jgi:hypothetical protein